MLGRAQLTSLLKTGKVRTGLSFLGRKSVVAWNRPEDAKALQCCLREQWLLVWDPNQHRKRRKDETDWSRALAARFEVEKAAEGSHR